MILSHRHKFIFFCNGKTGTTSIEKSLERLDEGKCYTFNATGLFIPKHVPPVVVRGLLPREIWKTYYKFVFVRNPYAWVVSQWKYNFRLTPQPARNLAPATAARIKALNNRVIGGRRIADLAGRQAFSMDDIEILFAYLRDNFRSVPYADGKYQASYVVDLDGQRVVDCVGRFESLEQDYAGIAGRLGLDPRIPHVNRTEHRDFRTYYTPVSAAAVARLWKTDFDTLDYPTALGA